MTHTPAPWAVKHNPSNVGALERFEILSETTGDLVAAVRYYHSGFSQKGIDPEWDARLIAAAPELLEALEGFLDTVGKNEYPVTAKIAMEAIAKARGQA